MNSIIINAEIVEYVGTDQDGDYYTFIAHHTTPEGQVFRFNLITDSVKGPRLWACLPIAKNVEIFGHLDAIAVVAEGIKLVLPNLTAADADPVVIQL